MALSPKTVFSYDFTKPALIHNVNNNVLGTVNMLAGTDTVHDFKEGDRISNIAWTGGVEAALKLHLERLVGPSSTLPNWDASYWLTSASNNAVTSRTEVENQTVASYENQFAVQLHTNFTVTTTYDHILERIKYYQGLGQDTNRSIVSAGNEIININNILDVDMGDEYIKFEAKYSRLDKMYIALFMLNFFFPPTDDDIAKNTTLPTYITFDAGSHIPDKIFGPLDQVINLITPLNIADSATSSNHLVEKGKRPNGVKNKYEFPVNTYRFGDTVPIGSGFAYTSNIYSFDTSKLYIPRPQNVAGIGVEEYTEKNKYDFSIFLNTISNNTNTEILKFDSTSKNGPGVTYISNLIGDKSNAFPSNGMADADKLVKIFDINNQMKSQILFDIKRGGDWEQCNAAYTINNNSEKNSTGRVILCTIDRLCSLYSRCIGQDTIWHNDTHMKLYRFLNSGDNASILAAQTAEIDARSAKRESDKKTIIKNILPSMLGLINRIDMWRTNNQIVTGIVTHGVRPTYILSWLALKVIVAMGEEIKRFISSSYPNDANNWMVAGTDDVTAAIDAASNDNNDAFIKSVNIMLNVNLTIENKDMVYEMIQSFDITERNQKLGYYYNKPFIFIAKPAMSKLGLDNLGFGKRSIEHINVKQQLQDSLFDFLQENLSIK